MQCADVMNGATYSSSRCKCTGSGGSRISRRGRQPRRGDQLPTRLYFIKFVCQNERIGTLTGGAQWVDP